MNKRVLATAAIATLGFTAFAGPIAFAHPSGQGECDTTHARKGHHDNGNSPGDHTNYDQLNAVDGTQLFSKSGHYVLRGKSYYVEVVGGAQYDRPGGGANQGGFAQGDADGNPTPVKPDFHAGAYAPYPPSPSPDNRATHVDACVGTGQTGPVEFHGPTD